MTKSKGSRTVITIECLDCRQKANTNKRTAGVSRYSTTKNKRNDSEKLKILKHCKFCNKHTLHKEIK